MQERFIRRAIELAVQNVRDASGGPFGAVIVRNGEIIAEGTNLVTPANDPTAHAEIVAIRRACDKLATFALHGCEIYSSCEPCPMCLAAIYWARLDRLRFAATRADAAAAGFDDSMLYEQIALPIDRRSLPTAILLQHEGEAAFRAWAEAPKRTPY